MRSKPMILAALLLAAFLVNLDTTLVKVALPDMVRCMPPPPQLQWVVDAYNLVFAALLLTFGSLSDRFGRKAVRLDSYCLTRHQAPLAQLAEQRTLNPRVRGSSPWRRTRPDLVFLLTPYPGR